MIQTDWILWKLLMRNISVAELSICWRYEWDWNEHSQSRHLLVLLQKKKTTWSVKCHDFQKHNITWDTMLRRCREDDISRRTVWFARTRILQKKKNIHLSLSMLISITWYVIWTIPMIMTIKYMISDFRRSLWIYHLQRNWREEVFGNKFL